MICIACRERRHADCPGGTWCDCQHQPAARRAAEPTMTPQGAAARTAEQADAEQPDDGDAGPAPQALDGPAAGSEPAMNWLSQG